MAPLIQIHQQRCRRAAPLTAAAILLALLAACTTTRFPENPEQHRLYGELLAAGHEYYFNVGAGVKSLVLGILPESEARAAAAEIRSRWGDIDPLDTAAEIVAYLDGVGLAEVAGRISETLEANASGRPTDGVDERLEAAAVKQGLIDAFFELNPPEEPSPTQP